MIVLHHILHPSNDGNQSYQRKYLYDRKSSTNGKSSYYGSSAYDEHPSYIFLSETLDSPLFSPHTRSLWVYLVYELIISKQRHIFQRKQWHSVIWWITTIWWVSISLTTSKKKRKKWLSPLFSLQKCVNLCTKNLLTKLRQSWKVKVKNTLVKCKEVKILILSWLAIENSHNDRRTILCHVSEVI